MKPEPLIQRSLLNKGIMVDESKPNNVAPLQQYGVIVESSKVPAAPSDLSRSNWTLRNDVLRSLPSYYPLEKSCRFIQDATPSVIANRISEVCRIMSVYAQYDNDLATASLFTSDHVEIHVSLWQGNNCTSIQNNDQKDGHDDSSSSDPCTIVEIQRRKGCPIRYHRYCRLLLDAASMGHLPDEYTIDADKLNFSKQVMKITEAEDWQSAQTNTLLALDIAASLLKKDRMDARELGMESLCLLTDSTKTGFRTAVIASRAVLLGSYYEVESVPTKEERLPIMNTDFGIREAVLSFIQLGRLSDDGEYKDASEESLLDSNSEALIHPEQREHYYLLHNLALNVLANALDVLQQEDESNHNETTIESMPTPATTSTTVQESPVSSSKITNKFLKESAEISQRELISTLLGVLGQAASKPHNACLSAQCLRHLFQASITARRRARDLNAKQIVSTALDVGRRTHAKLELEAEKVKHELMQFDDEEDEESERELDE